jgi:hypothetical protein
VLVLAAIAVPATAQTFDFSAQLSATPCITIADTQYRLATGDEYADVTVRIDPAAAAPDLWLALTDTIDEADFVLIGADAAAQRCRNDAVTRTVRIDRNAAAPDWTIGLVRGAAPADYRIYLRANAVAPEATAALYAAAQMSKRRFAGTESN